MLLQNNLRNEEVIFFHHFVPVPRWSWQHACSCKQLPVPSTPWCTSLSHSSENAVLSSTMAKPHQQLQPHPTTEFQTAKLSTSKFATQWMSSSVRPSTASSAPPSTSSSARLSTNSSAQLSKNSNVQLSKSKCVTLSKSKNVTLSPTLSTSSSATPLTSKSVRLFMRLSTNSSATQWMSKFVILWLILSMSSSVPL